MKRILLIISLVACFAMASNAQNQPFRLGFKMGPSIDWASAGSTVVENHGAKLGFGAGFVVDYHFNDYFAVTSGLNFNDLRMGYRFMDSRGVEDFLEDALVMVDRRVRTTYFEVPLMARADVKIVDSWKAYVEAGVGLGVNSADKAKDEYSFCWIDYADESYVDYSYQYRILQASMCFALGAEYDINPKLSLFAQLSFCHSFSNAFTHLMQKQTGSIARQNFIGLEIGFMH